MQPETTDILQNLPVVGVIVTAIILFLSWYYRKYRNVPPGPLGIPFVGYGPLLGSDPPEKLTQLKKHYGKVMSISFGPQLTIILNDYEAVKEAFIKQGDKFIGRPSTFMFDHLVEKYRDGRPHGLGGMEGEDWKQMRRFVLQTLRDLGMGKDAIQNRILDEAEHLSRAFQENIGKPFDPMDTLNAASCNVISILCFGHRFDYKDPEFRDVLLQLKIFSGLLAQAGPLQAYPSLRFIPGPLARTWSSWIETQKKTVRFVKNQMKSVQQARNTVLESVAPSFIDSFWTEKDRLSTAGNQPERSKIFQDLDLRINVQGMFGAGTETTAVSINWCILFMLHHSEIQTKLHKTIDQHVGRERSITAEDKAKLSYLEAVIREAQRLGNVVPFGLIRCNTEEVELMGYRIPDRSYVMVNYKAVNMDPKLWDNPQEFRPERFINAQGRIEEPPYFMPFATGKRTCVGESLARMELFLLFANLMQRFEFKPLAGQTLPPADKYITGISCRPLPYQMDIRLRK